MNNSFTNQFVNMTEQVEIHVTDVPVTVILTGRRKVKVYKRVSENT